MMAYINVIGTYHNDVIGNVRKAQEDSHGLQQTPNGWVFVVCDGMGGHVGGKQASSIAVKSILEYLGSEIFPDPVQALDKSLQFANMQILGHVTEHPELKGMGTTACIVLIREDQVYVAHVGDSRIYLFQKSNNKLIRLTKDHSLVQKLIDTGQISEKEAESHPQRNVIMKALGIKPDLQPTINRVHPNDGDIFLICSDGLSGMISDDIIAKTLSSEFNLQNAGDKLINLALNAGGTDNITVELIKVSDTSTHATSKPATTSNSRKNNIIIRICWCLLAILAVCGGYILYNYQKKVSHKEKLEELTQLHRECDSVKSKIANTNKIIDRANAYIKQNEEKKDISDEYKSAYIKAVTAVENKRRDIDSLANQLKQKENRIQIIENELQKEE